MIVVNFLSGLLFFLFYFPPTFEMKFHNRTVKQQVKEFDYLGTFLFVCGFVLFLLGLSWGGSVYPWKSVNVLTTLLIGFAVLVAFALWEMLGNPKEPLLPLHLFKNFGWVVACILLGLGAR
jgi:MFS-type transporter involved in bile tolerance (Atg22 family)